RVKLNGRNVEFKIGNVEQIPLPDASVDAVIGNMILHHCLNPDVAVKDMARVLVPGGRLALSDLQQHNFEFLRKEHADTWLGFEISRVRTILDQAGFTNVKVEGLESCCSTTVERGQVKIPMFLASGQKLQLYPSGGLLGWQACAGRAGRVSACFHGRQRQRAASNPVPASHSSSR